MRERLAGSEGGREEPKGPFFPLPRPIFAPGGKRRRPERKRREKKTAAGGRMTNGPAGQEEEEERKKRKQFRFKKMENLFTIQKYVL